MSFKAVLKDTRNGSVHTLTGNRYAGCDAHNTWYLWVDGNYGCDCNRSMFIHEDESMHLPCNTRDNVIELVELWHDGKQVEL